MQRSKIKVGRYYLDNVKDELYNAPKERMVGKLLEISSNSHFEYEHRRQKYFFEFATEHPEFHNGLDTSKVDGLRHRCYFVSLKSIIKRVDKSAILTYEL